MSPQKQVCRIQRGLPRAFQQQKGQLAADAQTVQLPKGQLVLSGIAELHGLAGVAQAPCQTENAVLLPGGKPQITGGHPCAGQSKIEAAQHAAGPVVTFQKCGGLVLGTGTKGGKGQRDPPFGGQREGGAQAETGVDHTAQRVPESSGRRFQRPRRSNAAASAQKGRSVCLDMKRL